MVKAKKNKVISKGDAPIFALEEAALFTRLGADTGKGLSPAEAAKRLASFGPNAITQAKQTPVWKIFLRQFKSPIVLLLVIAAGMSFAFQEWLWRNWSMLLYTY